MYRNKLKNKAEQRRKRIDEILNSQFAANPGDQKRCSAVAEISKAIASAMGLSAGDTEKIHLAGMMHDIGKIAVNQEVWQKAGSLNFTEWGKIKKHAEIGCRILSSDTEYAQIAPYVMEHHERWDGTGYPNGLKGRGDLCFRQDPCGSRCLYGDDIGKKLCQNAVRKRGGGRNAALRGNTVRSGSSRYIYRESSWSLSALPILKFISRKCGIIRRKTNKADSDPSKGRRCLTWEIKVQRTVKRRKRRLKRNL